MLSIWPRPEWSVGRVSQRYDDPSNGVVPIREGKFGKNQEYDRHNPECDRQAGSGSCGRKCYGGCGVLMLRAIGGRRGWPVIIVPFLFLPLRRPVTVTG